MKTKFFQICAGIFLFIATEKASAQDFAGKNKMYHLAAYYNVRRYNNSDTVQKSKPVTSVWVNSKVTKSFAKYFNNPAQQNWFSLGKKFFTRFYNNGILTNALFSKNGQLVYSIKYGTEKNLPPDVRKMVKSEYYDYNIYAAIEVNQDNRDIWIVKLDNDSEFITVRVEDEEMEQVEQFKKAN